MFYKVIFFMIFMEKVIRRERKIPELKELYLERMKELLSGEDLQSYLDILKITPVKSFRCNTLKIAPDDLKKKLEGKGWEIEQPWADYPEVMIVKSILEPGELGRSLEHLLGYYYIQELASILPIIALRPKAGESFFDLCAAPGSKTTQAACFMKGDGSIFANELSMGRIKILASNLERCGVNTAILTKREGGALCDRFLKHEIFFDKILVDAPCSGEGTLRSSLKTYAMWNINTVKSLSGVQKNLFKKAFNCLEVGGEMIYSTCTHAPEENEAIVSWALLELGDAIEIIRPNLPIKFREGVKEWQGEKFDSRVKDVARVYPHDNNTEGFFVSKFRRVK